MPKTKEKYLTKEELTEQITDKFGSVAELARVVGTTKQNIYYKLENISAKFANELEGHGIMVRKSQIGNHNVYSSDVNENLTGLLQKVIEQQLKSIDRMEQSLAEKDKMISQCWEEVKELRLKCEDCKHGKHISKE